MAEPLPNPTFDPDSLAGVPFHEAIAWHAQQAPWISGSSWLTMAGLAAEKGELASEATLLGMVDDVWTQIGKAVEEGLPYGDFTRNLAERLQSQWWRVDSPRLNLIYHNNVGNALMAGRYAQLTDPVVMAARPFWLFDAIMDARTTVDICVPRDGVVLPADDPWWKRNTPLLHHGCRSGIISLDPEEAADFGGVSNVAAIPMENPDTGWGSPASWVDWKPKPDQYHAPLWDEYIRYTTGLDYIHTKGEWDAKVQGYVVNTLQIPLAARVRLPAYVRPLSEYDPQDPFAEFKEVVPGTGEIVWKQQPLYDGEMLNGVAFKPAVDGYWTNVKDTATGEPPVPTGYGKVSTGLLVMEPDGRVWVVEPKDHFGGYEHTFPKGKLEPNLTPQQNALKEMFEEGGLSAEITGYVGDFKGTTGISRYYLAKRTGGQPWTSHWESEAVKLVSVDDALNNKLNTKRDKEILQVALAKTLGLDMPKGLETYVPPTAAITPAQQPIVKPSPAVAGASHPYGLDPAGFVFYGAKDGGSSFGFIVAHPDAPGRTFMIKSVPDAFKAEAEVTGAALYQLVNDDTVPAMKIDRSALPAGLRVPYQHVTIQEMLSNSTKLSSKVGWKGAPDFANLNTNQQAEILAHGVASWMAGDHDAHVDQYRLHGDKVVHIDLGQALKYTLTTGDKLSLDYHPNDIHGEAQSAHLLLLKDIKAGKIDKAVLHHPKVKAAIDRAKKITAAQIDKALGAYGDLGTGGKSRQQIVDLLTKRAKNIDKDWARLFEDVTGKPFAWDETVKQPKQKAPRRAKQAEGAKEIPKVTAGVAIPDVDHSLDTFGAVSIRADKDILRGQSWRVQKQEEISSRGTKQSYTFQGELDQSVWPRVRQAMVNQRATTGEWKTAPRKNMFQPGDTARSPKLQIEQDLATAFLGSGRILKDPQGRYEVAFGDPSISKTAMQGKVRIKVFESDPEAAQAVFKDVLKKLEVPELAQKPPKDAARLALANQALWNIEGGKYRPAFSADEAVSRLEAHGLSEKDIISVQNERGYLEPKVDGRWEKYREEGIQYLYHQFTAKEVSLRGLSGADGGDGGILSTVARSENGIVIGGLSSPDDLESGGATSAFTRLVGKPESKAAQSWYAEYSYTAVLTPKLLDRIDWYGYEHDSFGRTSGYGWESRNGADAHVRAMVHGEDNGNETMFRNAVDRESILFFAAATPGQRDAMLRSLKDAGVQTIRGQPVEEMVVVMATPLDRSHLNPKNPVHAFLMGKRKSYPAWTEKYGGNDG